ncbi:MAG: Rieske 2Fe-2S protein [Chloroflexi bacterium]|nr:Rieske 2Fe-2S protein [Chloroflexota bacterium]
MQTQAPNKAFSGYYHRDVPEEDAELTHVGPGTPCGEYLRRFWHPVFWSSELKDLPKRIRILGEDLVIFRDGRGEIGLLALHCSHRGTSLEYGMVEGHGIRCCYHGWLYDVDGRLLEAPGEPPDSTLSERIVHGAYPTLDYHGLVFAYMGPPESRPDFPIYDSFELPGYHLAPSSRPKRDELSIDSANWLQLAENNIDVVHAVFLHYPEVARAVLAQHRPSANSDLSMDDYFNRGLPGWDAALARVRDEFQHEIIEWQESPLGVLATEARPSGDLVWVRLTDYILPNVSQFPPHRYEKAAEEVEFEPPDMTGWTVPIDDTHTIDFSFRHVRDGDSPVWSGAFAQAGNVKINRGVLRSNASLERSYEERQRQPGDYEAQQSQRAIAVHAAEHLGSTDRGVVLVRKMIREGIRAVQAGREPLRPTAGTDGRVATYCRNTILNVPSTNGGSARREQLRSTMRGIADAVLRKG